MYLRTGKWLAFGVLGLVLSAAEGVLADSPDAVSGDETVCLTRLFAPRGSTLCIHDGRLESTMLDGYAAAEKVGGNRLDACSVTQYVMPLTLAAGTLSVQDGVATARTVDDRAGNDVRRLDATRGKRRVSYFLVLEMFGNDDGRYRSVYAYKDIDGPFKYGPVWDFDFGVGNYQMAAYNPEAWLANYHRANAFKEWADDPWFCTLLWTRYPAARAAFEEIVKDGGLIDQYYEQLRIPAEVNERKWRHHYGYQGGIYGTGSHPGLKAFFKTRLAWMDRQFTDVSTLMASLKAGTRTTPSAAPYTPDAQSLPIRFLNAPSGYVPQREPLKIEVAVGDTSVTRVGVYANAVKVGEPCVVQDGRIALRVPMARLTARRGEPNCISFVAYTASGACVARNYALVWIDWTQQGFQFLIR